MRPGAYLLALCLVAVCGSPAWATAFDLPATPSFPAQFRGDWYGARGKCDKDKIALQIGATSLNYFDEFSGQLARIVSQTERDLVYVARYNADGREWEATETLRLSANGTEMKLEPERTSPSYFRCTVPAR